MKKELINLKSTLLENLSKEDIEILQVDIINSIPVEHRLETYLKLKKFSKLIDGLLDSVIKTDAIKHYNENFRELQVIDGVKIEQSTRKTWKYSDELEQKKKEVKALEKLEQAKDIAKVINETKIFKATVL